MADANYDLHQFMAPLKKEMQNVDIVDQNVLDIKSTQVFPEYTDYDELKDLLRKGEKELAKICIEKGCSLNKGCADSTYDGTPLHLAVSLEYPDIVELLLKKGADINSLNDTKDTPLILAAVVGNSEIIDLILSKTEPKSYSNDDYLSHFHIACMRNNVDLIQRFLATGIDIDMPVSRRSMFWAGFTPLHFAVEFKCVETAKLLMDKRANIEIQDTRGLTPLHLAFRKRNRLLTDLLLSKQYYYASNPADSGGLTHFHIACAFNNREVVEDFLDKKIDVSQIVFFPQTWGSYCCFKFAIDNQCIDVLEYLLGCDDSLGRNNSRILDYAYNKRNQCILNLIISSIERDMVQMQCSSELVNTLNEEKLNRRTAGISESTNDTLGQLKRFSVSQYTELHLAVLQRNDYEINSILRTHHSSVILVTDARRKTPLHLAFETNQKYLIEQFLPLHLQLDENPINFDNFSHFHISCTTTRVDLVEDFIIKGVDLNMPIKMDSKIWAGCTPLHLAIMHIRSEIVKLLLDNGADFTLKNDLEISPYELAIPNLHNEELIFGINNDDHNDWSLVEQILLANESRKLENFEARGLTLLHVASAKGDIDMINHYVSADTINLSIGKNLEPWNGFTPLHFAACFEKKDAVKVLLNLGADPAIENNCEGCIAGHYLDNVDDERMILVPKIVYDHINISIFHAACRSGNRKVIQHFLNIGANIHQRILHSCNEKFETIGEEGKNPLHIATSANNVAVVKLLLECGADVNVRDCYFNTPLHFCKTKGVLEILLDYGADQEALNCEFISALDSSLSRYDHQFDDVTAVIESGWDINRRRLNFKHEVELSNSTVLARHLERLTMLGIDMNEQNRIFYDSLIASDAEIRRNSLSYKEKCAGELKLMKAVDIDTRTTLHDILFKSSIQMAKYSMNETLRKIVVPEQDLRQKYPIYAYLIILQFNKGKKRAILMEEGKKSLNMLMNRWMGDLVLKTILEFMNDHEITYLHCATSGQNIFQ